MKSYEFTIKIQGCSEDYGFHSLIEAESKKKAIDKFTKYFLNLNIKDITANRLPIAIDIPF